MPSHAQDHPSPTSGWRRRLHEIIFESDTFEGRVFDIALIVAIVLSVATVVLESVESFQLGWGPELRTAEWVFTILFTFEFLLRLISVRRPIKYATSFLGVIDIVSIVPTYLTLFIPGAQVFLIIRMMRLLRLFRVFKMARYVHEAKFLLTALQTSKPKIIVFLLTVVSAVTVVGALMYLIEGPVNDGFSNIPKSVYWAIVTVTTVGFGDYVPITVPGRVIASFLMILGYGIIAVPTGILSVELARAGRSQVSAQSCPSCGKEGHDPDATNCKFCGTILNP